MISLSDLLSRTPPSTCMTAVDHYHYHTRIPVHHFGYPFGKFHANMILTLFHLSLSSYSVFFQTNMFQHWFSFLFNLFFCSLFVLFLTFSDSLSYYLFYSFFSLLVYKLYKYSTKYKLYFPHSLSSFSSVSVSYCSPPFRFIIAWCNSSVQLISIKTLHYSAVQHHRPFIPDDMCVGFCVLYSVTGNRTD